MSAGSFAGSRAAFATAKISGRRSVPGTLNTPSAKRTSCAETSRRCAASCVLSHIRGRKIPAQGCGGLVAHGAGAGACERAMTRDGTVGRPDATERSLPFHWDIDPARMMRPRPPTCSHGHMNRKPAQQCDRPERFASVTKIPQG
jgi:hypothetical protein